MTGVASLRQRKRRDLGHGRAGDRRSWAILRPRKTRRWPVDPAEGVGNAENSVSHTFLDGASRRPQGSTGPATTNLWLL
jgi:hypothetical protein